MRWDDSIFSGTHGKWTWIVVRQMIRDLPALTREHHAGQRLCITAFDSGPITPSADELSLGWTLVGDVMVSPPLTPQLQIPFDTHDEWYVFRSLPDSLTVTDRYVNYCGFNLADPHTMAGSQDASWDRTNYDWLIPIQRRFWADIERLDPSSYVCSGDADTVVTRDQEFAARFLDIARAIAG
ncbi:hypothetical protein [Candidatus Laterigemmans baculatus]|uniref:hypothetical protein n=1 Tax=Candidatus Laterigemmans baculatus TaxID=2770505 RepID=UPI0013DA81E8|nr:hypothetical protein [Candidatus Laterigemmans baculatus]